MKFFSREQGNFQLDCWDQESSNLLLILISSTMNSSYNKQANLVTQTNIFGDQGTTIANVLGIKGA